MSAETILDIDILELMASKICHDLISPIGAVNNGLEFLEDMGPDALEDATSLIGFSAQQASAKLQAFRMAYGMGGADSAIKPEDVKDAIERVIASNGKITQDWDAAHSMGIPDDHYERPSGYCKMLICAFLLLMDGLPRGGVLSASVDNGVTTVAATGEGAAYRERMEDAVALKLHNSVLEPKHVHGCLTGLLAQRYGYALKTGGESGSLFISFKKI